ncbi:MAG: TIGR04086 family membrane protein [Firmicutes bacterium]|nr:TIGR04086 family membrane protein [Bacillota bacterium]
MAKRDSKEGKRMVLEPMALLQGVILAQFLWLLTSIVLAIIVYFSSWQASHGLLALLARLAALGGGIVAGAKCSERAWLHGVFLGILVFLIFSLVGYGEPLFVAWPWWKAMLKMMLVAMIGGITGGLFST